MSADTDAILSHWPGARGAKGTMYIVVSPQPGWWHKWRPAMGVGVRDERGHWLAERIEHRAPASFYVG